jgi:hypothetical protein
MAKRYASWKDYPKRKLAVGHWLCRWCSNRCPGRNQNFCSDTCRKEVAIRCEPTSVRYYVRERDDGVCAQCGLDAEALHGELRKLMRVNRAAWLRQLIELEISTREAYKTLWQADHIVAVKDGGGGCGLEGFRTLCIWCHKDRHRGNGVGKKPRKKTPKKASRRKPGLWLTGVRIEVEPVKKAHSSKCIACQQTPEIGTRRLHVKRGGGRSQVVEVYCDDCGNDYLARTRTEADNALRRLGGEDIDIRVDDEQTEAVKAEHKRRADERKHKREAKKARGTGG